MSEMYKPENEAKKEKREIREKIQDLLFLINQVSIRETGKEVPDDIRLGDVQSDDFISNIDTILKDSAFWDSLPENKDFRFVKFDKKDVISKLEALVSQHVNLG